MNFLREQNIDIIYDKILKLQEYEKDRMKKFGIEIESE